MNIQMRKALKKISTQVETIQEERKTVFVKHFEVTPDFIAFQGHFPAKAVLPAIVQIMMAQLCIEEAIQKSCDFEEIINAKFSAPIEPDTKVEARVSLIKENLWQCQISGNEQSAVFRLKCQQN